MSNTFEVYLGNFICILGIMKIFRMDLLSKQLLLFSIFIFALISSILIVISIIAVPFVIYGVIFGSPNETLKLLFYFTTPIVLIGMYFIYKDDIHEFIYNYIIDFKNDIYHSDRTVLSSITKNSPIEALNNFLYIIKNDLEFKIIYNLSFFIFCCVTLIDIYYFEHIPFLGFLEDYGVIFISKLHLIWLVPASFIFTYIYSKYYYDLITKRTHEKLITISKFIEYDGISVCLSEDKQLVIHKTDSFENSYKLSETITMIEIKNEIYYLLKTTDDYQTFKASYILLNNLNNKFVYKLKYYKDNFE